VRAFARGALAHALSYQSPTDLAANGDPPHVVVDGSPRPGTALTLSHWPGVSTPRRLAADLSVGIALRYVRDPSSWRGMKDRARYVTIDHLDQDGLLSCFALCEPRAALERRSLLVAAAAAGDFARCEDPLGGAVAFALATFVERGDDAPALLEVLPELLAEPARFRSAFEEEQAALTASREAIRSGRITLRRNREADLVVVTLPPGFEAGRVTRFAHQVPLAVHPGAIFEQSDAMSVLLVQGGRARLFLRYETWVQFVSRRLRARRDLVPLAAILSAAEPGGATWRADPVGSLEPVLAPIDGIESELEPERLERLVAQYLRAAPPAFDPFTRPSSAQTPLGER
jgi:hypothetical protein